MIKNNSLSIAHLCDVWVWWYYKIWTIHDRSQESVDCAPSDTLSNRLLRRAVSYNTQHCYNEGNRFRGEKCSYDHLQKCNLFTLTYAWFWFSWYFCFTFWIFFLVLYRTICHLFHHFETEPNSWEEQMISDINLKVLHLDSKDQRY